VNHTGIRNDPAGKPAAGVDLVPPAKLMAMLRDGEELAVLDVREELLFSHNHLLHARCAPLSRLELKLPQLVPRRATRIVLVDDDGQLARRAVDILTQNGYTGLFILAGGNAAWAEAGFLLFSGVHVPSKAFGEVIEHANQTPSIDAPTLKKMIDAGEDVVVVDSRPFDEFVRVSIPTAVNVPGAELVLHVSEIATSPSTTVVVNCAGRTRSIIGAQSLINAGLPNKVVALRNGTMGWTLAGYHPNHSQQNRLAPGPPSPGALAWARSAARKVGRLAGVRHIDLPTLRDWQAESQNRTLYLFDVRDPREYEAGHLPGAVHAPGGQLVQATDQYVGTFNSRIVLVDDLEVRAVMTASWLLQMGWPDVFVLVAAGTESGWPTPPVLGVKEHSGLGVSPAGVADLLSHDAATIVDLSLSREYTRGHIPGAWFAIRWRLDQAVSKIDWRGTIVLTSEDGMLARLALDEMKSLTSLPVRFLDGGNKAWVASGRSLTAENPLPADEALDVWLKPYERSSGQTAAMNEYLSWEMDLVERVAHDGSCSFRPLRAHSGAAAE
jgi:rhodanese-related sulfurtransferase